MVNNKTLRVAINAQVSKGGAAGGVEQFIIGLVSSLGRLGDGPEEYLLIVRRGNRDWLKPYLGANQHTVLGPSSKFEAMKQFLEPFRFTAGNLLARAQSLIQRFPSVRIPVSNGFFESLGVDIVHFPYQRFVRSSIPSVYNPHDLQHIHYPEFFSRSEIAFRELIYRAGCNDAEAVAMPSHWARKDVARQYAIAPQKIFAVLYGAPTELYETITPSVLKNVTSRFRLPQVFALYPAQTWEHKNHIRLLEALALLRDRDHLAVNLVCTGRKNDFWRVIERRICELRLENQVRFLGYVTATELRAIYHAAQFVIFPSLFEGGGLPVLESFHESVPVACSNVTALPEYAGDAALLFHPFSIESIADVLRRMTTDADLRETLRQRGSARIRLFTWERTAKTYRALYRQVARAPLSDEDRALLTDSVG